MPTGEQVLREYAAKYGWEIKELPAAATLGKDGYVRLTSPDDMIVLQASVPRAPKIGYDPWNSLYQVMAHMTMAQEG